MADVPTSLIVRSLELDRSSSKPLHTQLTTFLREGIASGSLSRGTRLPSTRSLAEELGVSRNTVVQAFDQLRSEGYLESRVGAGTFISEKLPERHTEVQHPSPGFRSSLNLSHRTSSPPHLSDHADRLMECSLSLVDDPIRQVAFRPGIPAFDEFPIETWSKLASRHWRSIPPERLEYGAPGGFPPLRKAVAKHLRTTRGVRCEADQVIIVSGVQQAFTLAARLLLNSGDEVCVEDPGYRRMRAAFIAAGARVHSVPVDNQGFPPSAVNDEWSPRMVGVTPSHQYPLGYTMSSSRRDALLKWSAKNDIWILEDDYDSHYRYSGRPIASLQGMDHVGQVLYTGTFSKVLFPALRLGYMVVPPPLVDPLKKMRAVSDRCPPRINQMILTDFVSEGYLKTHIRQMKMLYADRRDALLEALDKELPSLIDAQASNAGLHLIGWLPEEIDDHAVSDRLASHNIVALPLSFYAEHPIERGGLLLGYAGLPTEEIHKEVRRMADILEPFRSEL